MKTKKENWVGKWNLILLPWTILQNLLGFFVYLFCKIVWSTSIWGHVKGVRIIEVNSASFSGVSLGGWVLLGKYHIEKRGEPITPKHEVGHSIQSLIWGPLYLFVIGLPSITMNILSIFSFKRYLKGKGDGTFQKNYYKRFPENQADKFGGVTKRPDYVLPAID